MTLIVLGDFNAKIGKDGYIRGVVGRENIHDRTNNNGDRLCALVIISHMYIVSTKFKHKEEHKITWIISEKTEGNQIDYMPISKNSKLQNNKGVHQTRERKEMELRASRCLRSKRKIHTKSKRRTVNRKRKY